MSADLHTLTGAYAANALSDERTRSQRAGGGGRATTEPTRAAVSVSSRTSWSQADQASRCRSKASRSVPDSASAA